LRGVRRSLPSTRKRAPSAEQQGPDTLLGVEHALRVEHTLSSANPHPLEGILLRFTCGSQANETKLLGDSALLSIKGAEIRGDRTQQRLFHGTIIRTKRQVRLVSLAPRLGRSSPSRQRQPRRNEILRLFRSARVAWKQWVQEDEGLDLPAESPLAGERDT